MGAGADIYDALAAMIVKDGKLVDNPYTKWNEVNPKLLDWEIAAYIPGEAMAPAKPSKRS